MDHLPHNLSAEAAVIGSVMYDNHCWERVSDLLSPQMFYAELHGEIWQAMSDLLSQGRAADGITLAEQFKDQADYLGELLDSAAFGPEVGDYARMVSDMALRRELVQAGQGLAEAATAGNGEAALDGHDEALEQIRDKGQTAEPVTSLRQQTLAALNDREARLERLIPTGYPSIDNTIGGLEQGTFSVLGARPGMGKTVLGVCIGGNIVNSGGTVGYFSLEMPSEDIGFRLGAWEAWKSKSGTVPFFSDMKQAKAREDQEARVVSAIDQDYIDRFLVSDRGSPTLNDIRRTIRNWKRHCRRMKWPQPKVIMIDHMGHVRPDQPTRGMYERVTLISNGLLSIAKEFDVAILALSQLNRASSHGGARPSLHDLRDSGAVEQDANLVMFLHREDYYLRKEAEEGDEDALEQLRRVNGQAELIVAKARSGPTTTIMMSHSIGHNVFRDPQWKQGRDAA